jgi:8-oxo-dGTP pyrophosphatase MutT (NUDIX family)
MKLPSEPRFRSSAVCLRMSGSQKEILLVRMRDPATLEEFWVPPGGGIEKQETSQQAALRETLEETGETVLGTETQPVRARYEFMWSGQVHDCFTDFHLCFATEPFLRPKPVHDASYIVESRWFPVEVGLEMLKFHGVIHRAVKETVELAAKE